MSVDFFGSDPIPTKQPFKVQPTQQQKAFLNSKLDFLDPGRTKQIDFKTAQQFVKYSGLPPTKLRVLWTLANPDSKSQKPNNIRQLCLDSSTLTYDNVYVAFRGVAYLQQGIALNKQNLFMNVKCSLPVFQQDDQDGPPPPQAQQPRQQQQQQQQQPRPAQSPQPKVQPPQTFKHQAASSKNMQEFFPKAPPRNLSQQASNIFAAMPTMIAQPANPNDNQSILSPADFEKLWTGIQDKHHDMVSGSTVKKLYQSLTTKSNLSKAWTVCSQTEKGYLTKGQLYAFLRLINLAQGNIPVPDQLSPDLKQAISNLDDKRKKPTTPRMQEQVVSKHQVHSHSVNMTQSTHQRQLINKLKQNTSDQARNLELVKSLAEVSAKNTELTTYLTAYVSQTQSNAKRLEDQISKLKLAQRQNVERLNANIVKLQTVIVKQNSIIQVLATELANRNQMDIVRSNTLDQVPSSQSYAAPTKNSQQNQSQPPLSQNQVSQQNIQRSDTKAIASTGGLQDSEQGNRRNSIKTQTSEQAGTVLDADQMYIYQNKALNLLHAIRPISAEEYPAIDKRVRQMSYVQLTEFFAQMVKTYQNMQQAQQSQSSKNLSQQQLNDGQPQSETRQPGATRQATQNYQGQRGRIEGVDHPQLDKSQMNQQQKMQYVATVLGSVEIDPTQIQAMRQTPENLFF